MISDPDPITREGIKQMLASYDDLVVCCETASLSATLDCLQDSDANVCLLGIDGAREWNLGFLRQIKPCAKNTPLLAIGRRHERDFGLRAIRAGAAGYLPKACTGEQLAQAVRTAACHRPYVSETICEMIAESIVDIRAKRQYDKLSDIDFEIFCLMAEGLSTAQIARTCHLSNDVVRARRTRIREQTGLQSDVELFEYALRRKLIGHAIPEL